jgi:serine/threonine protein kinase
MASHVAIGEPAHDAERQAIRFLVDQLPNDYTVYSNAWVVDRSTPYEIDAIVQAPHGIYVVEIKSYRGMISGTDHDWFIPSTIRSPLKLTRKIAQILASNLKRTHFEAGSTWVAAFVFLSAVNGHNVSGQASKDRVHTRKSILRAIQDPRLIGRLAGRRSLAPVTSSVEQALAQVILGQPKGSKPTRRIREYELVDTQAKEDRYTEILAKHRSLPDTRRLLRVYHLPDLASPEEEKRVEDRVVWEAQVLSRLGRIQGVLGADPPFPDESGIVLPFEAFDGMTLSTWLERRRDQRAGRTALRARAELWHRMVDAIRACHDEGIVHRLLRPECVLVSEDEEPDVRITGFDLAKRMHTSATIALTSVTGNDDRLLYAAPEVVLDFSAAEPRSDQFSLGALLAHLLLGEPLFPETRALMGTRRLVTRVSDKVSRVPRTVDEAIARMLSLKAADRYASLEEAQEEIRRGFDGERRAPSLALPSSGPRDPESLKPGDSVGSDYEIKALLGQGGLGVVYAARHRISGRTRVLKLARLDAVAKDGLIAEWNILDRLDHRAIVRAVGDVSSPMPEWLMLVMERAGDETLRQALDRVKSGERPELDPNTQRRWAEDLLDALDYLEQQEVVHRDLKPENLLVGEEGLKVIDFNVSAADGDANVGTGAYRDPSAPKNDHSSDRYSAALCLFELYAGRHAFEGRLPEPGTYPEVSEDDIDPPGLYAFFRKALDPVPQKRFGSAKEMRTALLHALGTRRADDGSIEEQATELKGSSPLTITTLCRRAINQLRNAGIRTVGELLALSEAQIRAIHAVGGKTTRELLAFQEALREQGLEPDRSSHFAEPMVLPELQDCLEPVHDLALPSRILSALESGGYPTIGHVAAATRSELLSVSGIGSSSLADVVKAVLRYQERAPTDADIVTSLDELWTSATRPLDERQPEIVDRMIGVTRQREPQGDVAEDLELHQSEVSRQYTKGIERLDKAALTDALNALDQLLDHWDGVARLDDMAARIEREWTPGTVRGAGLVRLLVRIAGNQFHQCELDGVSAPVVARPRLSRALLRAFIDEAMRIGQQWPPQDPEPARETLTALIPEARDPLGLAARMCDDIEQMEGGRLYISPVDSHQSLGWVLEHARLPIHLSELPELVMDAFDDRASFDPEHAVTVIRDLGFEVRDGQVVGGRGRSVHAGNREQDALPTLVATERTYVEEITARLRDAAGLNEVARVRGYRLVVTPPESHAEIGRSIAAALDADFLSLEVAFFERHDDALRRLERAERFKAQRRVLTRAVEETVEALLDEHGSPARRLVLGDTGLLGISESLDLVRRLYDETLSGDRGFWVLVVPGVIHKRQPLFNERQEIWHLEGSTLFLPEPLPATA